MDALGRSPRTVELFRHQILLWRRHAEPAVRRLLGGPSAGREAQVPVSRRPPTIPKDVPTVVTPVRTSVHAQAVQTRRIQGSPQLA